MDPHKKRILAPTYIGNILHPFPYILPQLWHTRRWGVRTLQFGSVKINLPFSAIALTSGLGNHFHCRSWAPRHYGKHLCRLCVGRKFWCSESQCYCFGKLKDTSLSSRKAQKICPHQKKHINFMMNVCSESETMLIEWDLINIFTQCVW